MDKSLPSVKWPQLMSHKLKTDKDLATAKAKSEVWITRILTRPITSSISDGGCSAIARVCSAGEIFAVGAPRDDLGDGEAFDYL